MKKSIKKLNLNTETLRALSHDDYRQILGAACTNQGPSHSVCPPGVHCF